MYLQALGSVLGLIVCLYEYVCGDLFILVNKPVQGESLLNMFCGYTLYPLCIIVFLTSLFLPLIKKQVFLEKAEKFNKIITHFTVVIGLLGCKYYFIIPGLFILYRYYIPILLEDDLKRNKKEAERQNRVVELLNTNLGKHTIVKLLNVSYEEVDILELQYIKNKL